MNIERKSYDMFGHEAIVYVVSDDNGHTVQLTPSEALDALEWLDQHRSEIFKDLHPETTETSEQARTRLTWSHFDSDEDYEAWKRDNPE